MAELGNYNIPREYKDEDRWFRFFTKVQLLYIGVAIALSIVVIMLFNALHMLPVGIVFAELNIIAGAVLAFIRIPEDRYMIGGGYLLRTILMRLIVKNLPKNKKIYLKNYDEEE